MKVYYVDIDGTMTYSSNSRWGSPNLIVINIIKKLITESNIVIIWSAGGWQYAKDFCIKYKLNPTAILPKPDCIIDDIFTIRTEGIIKYIKPENIIKELKL